MADELAEEHTGDVVYEEEEEEEDEEEERAAATMEECPSELCDLSLIFAEAAKRID